MNNSLLLYSGIMLLGVLISAVSQVLLKKAAMKTYDSMWKEYLNFSVIFAYCLFVLATLASIWAYRVVPLSMGPILEATSYIYVTFFGVVIFKETLNGRKILALGLILCGILIYSLS